MEISKIISNFVTELQMKSDKPLEGLELHLPEVLYNELMKEFNDSTPLRIHTLIIPNGVKIKVIKSYEILD